MSLQELALEMKTDEFTARVEVRAAGHPETRDVVLVRSWPDGKTDTMPIFDEIRQDMIDGMLPGALKAIGRNLTSI